MYFGEAKHQISYFKKQSFPMSSIYLYAIEELI